MRPSYPFNRRCISLALLFSLRPTFGSGADQPYAVEAFCDTLQSKYSCEAYQGCEWRNDTCVDLTPERIEIGQEYLLGPLAEKDGSDIPPSWRVDGPLDNKKDRTYAFVVIPNCLDATDAETILSLRPQMNEKTRIKDRQDYLEHNHVVHRVEPIIKQQHGGLYEKLVSTMIDVDAHIWRKTENVDAIFPEIEFIDYQPSEGQGFGAHIDNGSLITAVFMTSDPAKDFEGGSLIFEGIPGSDGGERAVNLNFADCVVFRGNQLEHRVTTITKGRRMILQIELGHTHTDDEDDSSDDDSDDSSDGKDSHDDDDDDDGDDDSYDEDVEEDSREDGEEKDSSPPQMEEEL